jgi:hypothetical protein
VQSVCNSAEYPPEGQPALLDVSVVASGPWYESDTFWSGAAALVGIAAIVVSLIIWRVGPAKRLLVYSMPVSVPMVSSHWPVLPGAPWQVTLEGDPVADPHVVVLYVHNRSRRDIRSTDFDQNKPLVFNFGVRILATSLEGGSRDFKNEVSFSGTEILISPTLIAGNQRVQLTVITHGVPRLTYRSPLVGVKIREESHEGPSIGFVLVLAGIIGAAVVLGLYNAIGVANNSSRPLGIANLVVSSGGIALIVTWVRNTRRQWSIKERLYLFTGQNQIRRGFSNFRQAQQAKDLWLSAGGPRCASARCDEGPSAQPGGDHVEIYTEVPSAVTREALRRPGQWLEDGQI